MHVATYDEALAVARRLPLAERLRLASALTGEAAGEVSPVPHRMTPDEARAALADIRAAFAAQPGPRLSLGEQIEADRHARDRVLSGRDGERDDVDA
ncbi:MAG: hypothetical protein WCG26_13355 [Chloroflexales bacterium]